MEQGIEKHICRRGDFQPFLPWSRMPQIQAIRMVYVTARLSFMPISAYPIITLPLLLAFYQVADCGTFWGFQAEDDLHFGDVIILISMQSDVAVHWDHATLPCVAFDSSLSVRVVCLVLN